ncbi:MAG: alanine dehydrogenase, partial [Pirellulaceae bacterium]
MIIGVPSEIKEDEYRVAMLPVGVEELVHRGHRVLVQAGAGLGSGIADHDYLEAGAEMVAGPEAIFGQADLIVKVKEPLVAEWKLIRPSQTLFTYFHFAASRDLTVAMQKAKCTCLAYETLKDSQGRLPLLTPMSEVAGRMSIQEGAKYLERPQMGRGILLGGVPGVPPAHIAVLGGGIVGANAARIAAGFQADVVLLDVNLDRLRYLADVMPPPVDPFFLSLPPLLSPFPLSSLFLFSFLLPFSPSPP